ncbi:MAG: phage tail protein [Thermoanaerobaculia bacterium]
MAEPFLSEVRLFSFNFAPKGWAFCNGQFMPINQNQALFSLLGTTYGGNGQTNFALPDLRGRTAIHTGSGFPLGQQGGETAHTLNVAEMPTHIHQGRGTSAAASTADPTGNLFGSTPSAIGPIYSKTSTNLASMNGAAIGNQGGSQPHENMQPYLTINFCIALQGIFPTRN